MGKEIERKFLVEGDAWREAASRSTKIEQGYFRAEDATVRVRIEDENAYLTIKGATSGITRGEWEYPIPVTDAEELLEGFCGERVIRKVRHYLMVGEHEWVVDEFSGRHEGLLLAEIELEHADEDFQRPTWLAGEVSSDSRYYNQVLANTPLTTNA